MSLTNLNDSSHALQNGSGDEADSTVEEIWAIFLADPSGIRVFVLTLM